MVKCKLGLYFHAIKTHFRSKKLHTHAYSWFYQNIYRLSWAGNDNRKNLKDLVVDIQLLRFLES